MAMTDGEIDVALLDPIRLIMDAMTGAGIEPRRAIQAIRRVANRWEAELDEAECGD